MILLISAFLAEKYCVRPQGIGRRITLFRRRASRFHGAAPVRERSIGTEAPLPLSRVHDRPQVGGCYPTAGKAHGTELTAAPHITRKDPNTTATSFGGTQHTMEVIAPRDRRSGSPLPRARIGTTTPPAYGALNTHAAMAPLRRRLLRILVHAQDRLHAVTNSDFATATAYPAHIRRRGRLPDTIRPPPSTFLLPVL